MGRNAQLVMQLFDPRVAGELNRTTHSALSGRGNLSVTEASKVEKRYRVRITTHLSQLMLHSKYSGVARQYSPSTDEMAIADGVRDPLGEEADSPVTSLIQRYDNRAAIYLTNACAAFCRFCLRKRKIGQRDFVISERQLQQCVEYLGNHSEIQEIILTGGDPLTLHTDMLRLVIGRLRGLGSIRVLRICSRMPVQLPKRIDDELCSLLWESQPLYFMLHTNHPDELGSAACAAIRAIVGRGVPMLCQSVLLRGVNDDVQILQRLFDKLIELGVKPYHLYQASRVRGTTHFIVPVRRALEIVETLAGRVSGLAMPVFVYNAEGGKGKIPLYPPRYVLAEDENEIVFRNFRGEEAVYYEAQDNRGAKQAVVELTVSARA